MNKAPLAVIILTYNEELNLPGALDSVCGWAGQVFVVDSFSTDRTVEIAKSYGAEIYQHPFGDYCDWAAQRNWALDNLPIKHDWVLFLDADERVTPELAREITDVLPCVDAEVGGFYINRRFVFMGRWLRHGGRYPDRVLRLVRRDRTRVLRVGRAEYFQVNGRVQYLKHDMLHADQKGLAFWISKHNRYSDIGAKEVLELESGKLSSFEQQNRNKGSQSELEGRYRIWIKQRVWPRLPSVARPLLRFFYRYFFQLGFLDGKEGLIYYVLHEFWYPFLIDAKAEELRRQTNEL